MKIVYPYNEILPLKKAHDAYIVRSCASLASLGHDVTLLCGSGSLSKEELLSFYKINQNNPLKIVELPILRRNNIFHLNWNLVFFIAVLRFIEKNKPDVVINSVLKLADFLLKKKVKGCKYVYEVHQLNWYPSYKSQLNLKKIHWERSILNRCDLVTVTTGALQNILKIYPYHLSAKVEVISLACDFSPLEKVDNPPKNLQIFYIGQLYAKQGLKLVLEALKDLDGIMLNVLGGSPQQVLDYENYCFEHNLSKKVVFKGFVLPEHFHQELKNADAFITTFENSDRMPYVAHTKVYEYLALKRPIVAPDLEIVREHKQQGILMYTPDDVFSLIETLKQLKNPETYQTLYQEVSKSHVLCWHERAEKFNALLVGIIIDKVIS